MPRLILIAALLYPLGLDAMPLVITLDFEDAFLAPAADGGGVLRMPVLSGQFDTPQFGNLTISAINTGGGPNIATLYDSTGLVVPGGDPDLEAPWVGGNAAADNIGAIVIVQENGGQQTINGGEYLTDPPDDEVGGTVTFEWAGVYLEQLSWYAVDAEADTEVSGSSIRFLRDGNLLSEINYSDFAARTAQQGNPIVWGDHTNNFIAPFTAEEVGGLFNEVEFVFTGSGAVGDLTYVVNPEPGTSLLLLGGLAWIGFAARRRAKNSSTRPSNPA